MSASKTVSTCAPEMEQGTHVFHVVGYSQHRTICDWDGNGNGTKKYLKSGLFTVAGHHWYIALFPGGIDGPVPISLVMAGHSAEGVLASYELRLVNQSTGLPFSAHKVAPRVFKAERGGRFGFSLMKQSLFESPTYLQNDSITIECIVTVLQGAPVPQTKSFPRIEVPPSDITEQFGRLLETGEGADVTFSLGAETFSAHKIVLATRSVVFKAQLYGPMKVVGTGPITIEDVQPDVFRALLHFIYTDSLPPLNDLRADDRRDMMHHLLVAADRYAIERLKLVCQSFLCENLNLQTVATTLALADQHNCYTLKDACIEFLTCSKSNAIDDLVSSQGYKNLKRMCPSVLVDAFERATKFHKA